MFAANYFAGAYFAEGPITFMSVVLHLIKATTKAVSGLGRYTRRDF